MHSIQAFRQRASNKLVVIVIPPIVDPLTGVDLRFYGVAVLLRNTQASLGSEVMGAVTTPRYARAV